MANCKVRTHNATAQKEDGGGMSFSSWAIGIKSRVVIDGKEVVLDHTEFQFSERYGRISFSATMRDGCKCARFKMIDYTKHPNRWFEDVVELTDEQEDMLMLEALNMAGLSHHCFSNNQTFLISMSTTFLTATTGDIFYGQDAMKYDIVGVVVCNISHRRIIPSSDKLVWCTEAIVKLLQLIPEYKAKLSGHPDGYRPDTYIEVWRKAA